MFRALSRSMASISAAGTAIDAKLASLGHTLPPASVRPSTGPARSLC